MTENHRKLVEANCIHCNKIILTRPDRVKKFCSKLCKKIHRNVEVKCTNCGKLTLKKKSALANSKHEIYFCSRECKDFAQSIKGGCEIIRPSHYGNGGLHFYKSLINKTDNPKCCDCGETKRYTLCVHHIDSDRENNSVDNLEIVCANCHMKRHLKLIDGEWQYGAKYLTPREDLKII